MRKFFAAAIAAAAALLLLPVLLVRNEPLVGAATAEVESIDGAEKVSGKVSFEPSALPSGGASGAPSSEPSAAPSHSRTTLAPITPAVDEPEGEDESEDGFSHAADAAPPPGAVSVSAELDGLEEPTVEPTVRVVGEGEMSLEDYVAGVVAAEMGPSFPTEARRAQAVAARSLALYRVEHPKHGDSAVCLSAGCCMAWKEPDDGALDAAQSTEGVVATYDGEPIMAAFFSGSNGATRSAAEVWGGGVPYLVSVSSPWETSGSIRGHGVGMSQYGAAGMADDGADYDEILRHYYTGIEVG